MTENMAFVFKSELFFIIRISSFIHFFQKKSIFSLHLHKMPHFIHLSIDEHSEGTIYNYRVVLFPSYCEFCSNHHRCTNISGVRRTQVLRKRELEKQMGGGSEGWK